MNEESVTVSITRTVKAGCEAEFERALHEFVQRSLLLPGQLGVHILRPASGTASREYGIVRKFCDRQALESFRTSPDYLQWNQLAVGLTEGNSRIEELSGLESWFTLPNAPLLPLPKWKMACATFLGVFPLAMLLDLAIGPVIHPWHYLIRNAIFNACIVASLTWAVMPLITRALHKWLQPQQLSK